MESMEASLASHTDLLSVIFLLSSFLQPPTMDFVLIFLFARASFSERRGQLPVLIVEVENVVDIMIF